jgi:hypothetical protein
MSTKKIQIVCTSPGMRRNGVEHPASAFYDEGHWTKEQLAAFRADPAFTVREVSDDENTQTDADFDLRVHNEVQRLLNERADALQASFEGAVAEKAKERVEKLQAEHAAEVTAFKTEIADLKAKLEAATKATAKAK